MKRLKHLLILGGGHAGSSAALAAANQRAQLKKDKSVKITLIDKSLNLTIRPRLYEYDLEDTQVPLKSFLVLIDVHVLTSKIIAIDLLNQEILCDLSNRKERIKYDALVVALGSQLIHEGIRGIQLTHNIDSFEAAKQFRDALTAYLLTNQEACRIAILGGGITGLELATELPITVKKIAQRYKTDFPQPIVYLLDRHEVAKNAGLAIEAPIQEALDRAKVHCIDHASISEIKANEVIYNETKRLEVDIIVSTLGLRANNLTNQLSLPKDQLGRLYVNDYLQLPGHANCFSAGDIAHAIPAPDHEPIMSCQQGRPQGRYAGYNAVSFLFDKPLAAYSQPNYVTCIDLGEFGAVYTEGWNRRLVKSGVEAKKIKQHINQDRIYPPNSSNKQVLLEAGHLEFITPLSSMSEKSKK
ncbi:NAD(P)/FAD-dependent oxidoreductase [Legionella maceachernii]|uniref:Respiratory NADH dehydrogenase 2/cupric reductase n=1 Tax=Legionella maceachernii TaxID=466 RepID=A0A0W0VVK8_9GAMM|nr:FAD-dependent oxidoreductase [Legionella maceachernii]KTD24156.1 respiratory NADH dehydrogenase 2/cupric reductase [Legionella maceachernii]SJZ87568.1 NADH dehydrogenase [Legionella maceachernii]SUO98926.1 NADH dehydrogenase-like protein yjlD [Legionella maceachernii]